MKEIRLTKREWDAIWSLTAGFMAEGEIDVSQAVRRAAVAYLAFKVEIGEGPVRFMLDNGRLASELSQDARGNLHIFVNLPDEG